MLRKLTFSLSFRFFWDWYWPCRFLIFFWNFCRTLPIFNIPHFRFEIRNPCVFCPRWRGHSSSWKISRFSWRALLGFFFSIVSKVFELLVFFSFYCLFLLLHSWRKIKQWKFSSTDVSLIFGFEAGYRGWPGTPSKAVCAHIANWIIKEEGELL